MKCELDYCIYNKEHTCALDEIQMDVLDMCSEYEIITIPKESVKQYKKIRLEEIKKTMGNHSLDFRQNMI